MMIGHNSTPKAIKRQNSHPQSQQMWDNLITLRVQDCQLERRQHNMAPQNQVNKKRDESDTDTMQRNGPWVNSTPNTSS